MLQIGVAVYYGQVKFLPKLRGIRTFSTLNWADVGLLQTDDPILAGVGVVVVHLLLLAVHSWDHGKAILQPAWEKGFAAGAKVANLFSCRAASSM